MYGHHTHSRTSGGATTIDWKQRIAEAALCNCAYDGHDTYMTGVVTPEMHADPKGVQHAAREFIKGAFAHARIDISHLGEPPVRLITDHRGQSEAFTLLYERGWGTAAKRLLEKTRAEQRGAAMDL